MGRTVEVVPAGSRPPVGLGRTPRCEPPFDDEGEPAVWVAAHQLTFDWSPVAPGAAAKPLSLPTRPRRRPGAGVSSDAKLAVHRFVRLCVEVLNGHRPPAHLRQVSRPADAGGVVNQALAGARRVAAMRKAARAPGRRPPRRPPPVGVIRLRLCEPRPGAIEAAVALVTGERTWAIALRMELHHDCWAATALRLI